MRFAAPLLYIGLVPWLSNWAATRGISDALVVGVVATSLVLVMVSETVPSPIGGEGNRLVLLLTAPLSLGAILWAKWRAWIAPVLGYGVLLGLALGIWRGLAARELVTTLIGIVLVLVGNAAVWVWGSAWDADLDAAGTGPEQTMVLEELPITPWRIVLVGLNGVVCVIGWALIWVLPLRAALPLLALIDVVLYSLMWQLSLLAVKRLLRGT